MLLHALAAYTLDCYYAVVSNDILLPGLYLRVDPFCLDSLARELDMSVVRFLYIEMHFSAGSWSYVYWFTYN